MKVSIFCLIYDTAAQKLNCGAHPATGCTRQGELQTLSYITANKYCKSRNFPNIDVRNYSMDLR